MRIFISNVVHIYQSYNNNNINTLSLKAKTSIKKIIILILRVVPRSTVGNILCKEDVYCSFYQKLFFLYLFYRINYIHISANIVYDNCIITKFNFHIHIVSTKILIYFQIYISICFITIRKLFIFFLFQHHVYIYSFKYHNSIIEKGKNIKTNHD